MTDHFEQTVLEHLQQLRQGIGELKQEQTELSTHMALVDQRLSQVERCLANLYGDFSQTRNRAIWTDEERAAFSNWLTTNADADDAFPKLPT